MLVFVCVLNLADKEQVKISLSLSLDLDLSISISISKKNHKLICNLLCFSGESTVSEERALQQREWLKHNSEPFTQVQSYMKDSVKQSQLDLG